MRFIIFLLLLFISPSADARILHVGSNTIKLSQTKTTSPALHIKVDNEIWYGTMLPTFIQNTLHIRHNTVDYSVPGCYVFDENKRLIDANENIYLKGTGTQWIDTNHIPTLVTRTEMELKFSDDEYKDTGYEGFFGIGDLNANSSYFINFGSYKSQGHLVYPWICRWNGTGGPSWCNNLGPIRIDKNLKTSKQTVILDAKNNYAQYGTRQLSLQRRNTTESYAIVLFGIRRVEKDGSEEIRLYSRNDAMYIYSTKIYEDDVLIRHFVPVPSGLKIGDFIVPENGMWDIVEQKFYGNMGTGEFIYGIDE